MRFLPALLALSLTLPAVPAAPILMGQPQALAAPAPASLDTLSPGGLLNGFRAVARYHDAANKAMGARFVHAKTGFTLDVLQIQSVPQGLLWVNSWPTSNKGEPHTQEHLLLGKGNRGRQVATLDAMSLADSNAYTEQRRTVYQFATAAGPETYYHLLEKRMDALLHPDYSDEEIRREVRNFGVTEGPDGKLRLEEKGTVYNEMVSTFERPWTGAFHRMAVDLYGPTHPLAYVSGGSPEALRGLQPQDIRKFHDATYHLANMGMVASLPREMTLPQVLARVNGILDRLEPNGHRFVGTFKTDKDLPRPQGAPEGRIDTVGFPDENAQSPGQVLFAWPASIRYANPREKLIAGLCVNALAGDATTTLYKAFIDSETRRLDVGATDVWGYFDDDMGHPLVIGLSDVGAAHLGEASVTAMRSLVLKELAALAHQADRSEAVRAFNSRLLAQIATTRRGLSKFVNTPPGFGFRNTGSAWIDHLNDLDREGGFEKSVTLAGDLDAIEAALKAGKNVWGAFWDAHGLGEHVPYGIVAKPDPALVKQDAADRQARAEAETATLMARYGAKEPQLAIGRYRAAYDAMTARLKQAEKAAAGRFIANPPMSRDPQLQYQVKTLAHRIPLVASTFDNMTSTTVGLALRVDDVPAAQVFYLSMLPTLMGNAGVIEHGKPVSYEEMSKRLRNEILSLQPYYTRNPRTRRCELVIRGAGNTLQETQRAIAWMQLIAFSPDWRVENLPRLRDVVDQSALSLHGTMKGREEAWVDDPAGAWRHQDDPLQLATGSFLSMEYNVHRLRWRLRDAGGPAESQAIAAFLGQLAEAPAQASRAELQALVTALSADEARPSVAPALQATLAAFKQLPPIAQGNAKEALKDLGLYLADLPDATLRQDWRDLCHEMNDDLHVSPAQTLQELDAVRKTVLNANKARMFMIGARASREALLAHSVPALIAGLDARPAKTVAYSHAPLITQRLRDREPGANPRFVGLVNPNTQSGVFINRAPGALYADTAPGKLLDFLAAKLYGGGGAQSVFMKTWGAGLAYSNGIGSSADSGQVSYYAERCPELPQTLRFVVGELKKAKPDPSLVEYAYAVAFDDSRAAASYEARGEAMAADLTDGVTPDVVKRFRQELLKLRANPHLASELYKRMPQVYGTVLPGLGGKVTPLQEASSFVIGPEKQMAAWEGYLQGVEGAGTRVYRLYPRDFWVR